MLQNWITSVVQRIPLEAFYKNPPVVARPPPTQGEEKIDRS